MFFQRIFTPGLAIHSYVLGDEKAKQCVVIDPTRHVTPYIIQAQNAGLDITAILETHVHADFVSGAKELKHQMNEKPRIYASGMGGVEWVPFYADEVVCQGTQIKIGELRLEVIHTPGHTPEHVMWICYDENRSLHTPWFAFTGDCLFVGSIGRPDLLGQKETLSLAEQLYHSVFTTLAFLPDFVEIFPTHGAGSLCGQSLNKRETSTLGFERRFNPYLKEEPEEQWIQKIQSSLPAFPPYFQRVKRINLSGPSLLNTLKVKKWGEGETSLSFDQLFLLDVRHPEAFAASHLQGALNIPFSHPFCEWAGWMLPADRPIGLVMESTHIASEIIDQLRLMGFDQEIWTIPFTENCSALSILNSFAIIDVEELAHPSMLKSHYVVDVRSLDEWCSGHIPQAHHLALHQLENSLKQLPQHQSIVLVCRSGMRASLAASLLEKHGFKSIINMRGGMQAWKQAALPIMGENNFEHEP